jgi:hypothetical protein
LTPLSARVHIVPMQEPSTVSTIAHIIQLAVAPVFLLTGIASLLNVFTQRLGRVIDRARILEREIEGYDDAARTRSLDELSILDRRMAVIHSAIAVCTLSALFVCIVVAILFVGDLVTLSFGRPVAVLFICAMLLLILGLLLFLWEVRLATESVRVRTDILPRDQRRVRRNK